MFTSSISRVKHDYILYEAWQFTLIPISCAGSVFGKVYFVCWYPCDVTVWQSARKPASSTDVIIFFRMETFCTFRFISFSDFQNYHQTSLSTMIQIQFLREMCKEFICIILYLKSFFVAYHLLLNFKIMPISPPTLSVALMKRQLQLNHLMFSYILFL